MRTENTVNLGSSPRVWGQESRHSWSWQMHGDHPHACGDKSVGFGGESALTGSSPRVWGQADYLKTALPALGIIPTRVGTRAILHPICDGSRDHPHACGDKLDGKTEPTSVEWIIPTRVGTSTISDGGITPFEDHPHACGDKTAALVRSGKMSGSSPRVWGQGRCCGERHTRTRIIPTRVGTRRQVTAGTVRCGDHPHACGDKRYTGKTHCRKRGSSPRVWGQDYKKGGIYR